MLSMTLVCLSLEIMLLKKIGINYNNFYDKQNDNIYDLFYQVIGEIMPDPSLKNIAF